MICTYIRQRVGEEKIVNTYDTESRSVKNVLDWINQKAGTQGWSVQASITVYADYPDTVAGQPGQVLAKHGTVFFTIPPGGQESDYIADGCVMSDLQSCCQNPHLVVRDIVSYAQLSVDLSTLGTYTDPDADKPAPPDWDAPKAPIGRPYENNDALKGYFYHRGIGSNRVGDEWRGPSGRRYKLEWKQFSPFAGVYAWRGL